MRSVNPAAQPALSRPLLASLLIAALLVTGCVYRLPIQQGNMLDPSQVQQLQEGMTRSQVSYLLGTPMVPSGFNNNRWDYLYYVKVRGLSEPFKRRLTVWFEDDKVSRIERENMDMPPAPPPPAPPPSDVVPPAATSATDEGVNQ